MRNQENKENISTIFLLPSTGIALRMREYFPKFGFVNTYISSDISYPFPCLYILFQPDKLDRGTISFFKELEKESNFIESFDLEKGQIVFTFRIPKKFDRDYNIFLTGKYSKMSKSFKDLFPKEVYVYDNKGKAVKNNFGSYLKEPSKFYHIFNRTEYLKQKWAEKLNIDLEMFTDDNELYDIQDPVKETLNTLIEEYIY